MYHLVMSIYTPKLLAYGNQDHAWRGAELTGMPPAEFLLLPSGSPNLRGGV